MAVKIRALQRQISARLSESRPLIQVVVGPRQVGKTIALKGALGDRGVYHSADSPASLSADVLNEWWNEAAASADKILAIDEIQKIIGWSEKLKTLWDRTPQLKVVVTGSSALLVEKGLKESLAGRFELIRAEHWNFAEAQEVFDLSLKHYLEYGCYPGSVPFLKDVHRWASYVKDSIVEPALGRDLLQLHPVENPALLRQVFGAAAALPAQIISVQKLQGSLQTAGSVPTIANYLRLLSEGFLVSAIQKYTRSQLRARQSIPKLIVHDNALIRAFERPVDRAISPDRLGRYVENAVGARLIEAGWDVYYWKSRNLEVDFVAIGPDGQHWAIEVKNTRTSREELRGLFEFCKQFPDFEPCLVTPMAQSIEHVTVIPVSEILTFHRKV